MDKKRNVFIDLLRFFAAFIVVFYHLYGCNKNIDNWYFNLTSHGWIGVPIFFVISGYCVTLSANKSKNSLDFIIRRLFRIFPLYWLSLIITLSSLVIRKSILGVNSIAPTPHSFSQWVLSIFNLTNPFTKELPMNWVYWTLTVELFFYLVIYFCLYFRYKVLDLYHCYGFNS